jgi:hypothetical protein
MKSYPLTIALIMSGLCTACGNNAANFGGTYSGTVVSDGVTQNTTMSFSQNSDDVNGGGNMVPQPTPSTSPIPFSLSAMTDGNTLTSPWYNATHYMGTLSLNGNTLTGTLTLSQGSPASISFNLIKQ